MSRDQIVELYLRGGMSRRTFVRRMVAAGITVSAAVSYAELLKPSPATAAPSRAFYYATPTPSPAPTPTATAVATTTATATATPAPTPAPTPTPSPTKPAAMDFTPPQVTVTILTKRRDSLIRTGLLVAVTLDEPGSIAVKLRDGKRKQISKTTASSLASRRTAGTSYLTLKLNASAKLRARRGALRWAVEVIGADGQGNTTVVTAPFSLG